MVLATEFSAEVELPVHRKNRSAARRNKIGWNALGDFKYRGMVRFRGGNREDLNLNLDDAIFVPVGLHDFENTLPAFLDHGLDPLQALARNAHGHAGDVAFPFGDFRQRPLRQIHHFALEFTHQQGRGLILLGKKGSLRRALAAFPVPENHLEGLERFDCGPCLGRRAGRQQQVGQLPGIIPDRMDGEGFAHGNVEPLGKVFPLRHLKPRNVRLGCRNRRTCEAR